MTVMRMGQGRLARLAILGAASVFLAGCQADEPFAFLQKKPDGAADTASMNQQSVKLVERDVEAPDVFQVTDQGLWDGRPSLGGVWVAHPDVKEPERVIIRNTENSKFVIGALFRRERETPGPVVQVSSDAAATLGMLAGAPTRLNITALRREEVPDAAAPVAAPAASAPAPAEVETSALDPIAGAASAIAAAEAATDAPAGSETITPPAQTAAVTPAAAQAPTTSSLEKPYLQIGIFSVEQNANNTATAMRQAGMVPTVLAQNSKGKPFWRVIVGPAQTKSERAALLKKIKAAGFTDAYAVTN